MVAVNILALAGLTLLVIRTIIGLMVMVVRVRANHQAKKALILWFDPYMVIAFGLAQSSMNLLAASAKAVMLKAVEVDISCVVELASSLMFDPYVATSVDQALSSENYAVITSTISAIKEKAVVVIDGHWAM